MEIGRKLMLVIKIFILKLHLFLSTLLHDMVIIQIFGELVAPIEHTNAALMSLRFLLI